jgi:hypothetical protein
LVTPVAATALVPESVAVPEESIWLVEAIEPLPLMVALPLNAPVLRGANSSTMCPPSVPPVSVHEGVTTVVATPPFIERVTLAAAPPPDVALW